MMATTATTPTTEEPKTAAPPRSLHDRCDRCGFRAYFIVRKTVENKAVELQFCRHHGNENAEALTLAGWDVWDFSEELYKKPDCKDDKNLH